MSLRLDVLIIFPSRSSLDPPAPSLRRVPSVLVPPLQRYYPPALTSRDPSSVAVLRSLRRTPICVCFAPAVIDANDCGLGHLLNARPQAFASHRGDHESSQVPVELLSACPALRPRRTQCTSPSRCIRCCLPLRKPRRLRAHFRFEAPSRGLQTLCVRFAAEIALEPRNTQSRPAANLCRGRTCTCEFSQKVSICRFTSAYLPPSPGLAWRTFRGNVARRIRRRKLVDCNLQRL
jgi:hypothetical protein